MPVFLWFARASSKCIVSLVPQQACASMLQILSAIGSLLKRFGDKALQPVEDLVQQHFIKMLMEPEQSSEDRWLALLLIADMIEHAPSSGKHLLRLMPKFLEYSTSDSKELVQVCCYCLGIVAEKHPQVRNPSVLRSVSSACVLICPNICMYASLPAVRRSVMCSPRHCAGVRAAPRRRARNTDQGH
jgi:hypothetical protein